jgi:hypothetical protein
MLRTLMTLRNTFAIALSLLAPACGGSQSSDTAGDRPTGSSGGANEHVELTLEDATAETIAHEDRVHAGDEPTPDGHPDAQFTAHIRGRISGLILTICDDPETPTATQWDTIRGQDPIPQGFLNHFGYQTWVLGVFDEHNQRLNRGDGSLPETTFSQSTTLHLFAAMRDTVVGGRSICLAALLGNRIVARASAELR